MAELLMDQIAVIFGIVRIAIFRLFRKCYDFTIAVQIMNNSRMDDNAPPVVETESFELICHYVQNEQTIGFQIPIGLNATLQKGLAIRPISERDVAPGVLLLGQQRGRSLPVASFRFAVQVGKSLERRPEHAGADAKA